MQKNLYKLNGVEYSFVIMPPTTALPLATKLGNIIGSGVGGIDIGDLVKLNDTKSLNADILNSLSSLLASLNSDDMMYIVMTCQDFIFVKKSGDSKSVKCLIDRDFMGKTLDLIKVVGHFLKFTFNDFFSGSLLSSENEITAEA